MAAKVIDLVLDIVGPPHRLPSTGGVLHDELTRAVFDALALPFELYAHDPDVRFQARTDSERAFRDVLGYRLYRDLRRGWRITAPNLEQCGLLEIRYRSLEEVCAADDLWAAADERLAAAAPEIRFDEALRRGGLVERADEKGDAPGYQVPASALAWVAGHGSRAFHDPIAVPSAPAGGRRTHPFFVDFYRDVALATRGLMAHEHTAQVPYEVPATETRATVSRISATRSSASATRTIGCGSCAAIPASSACW